MTKKEAASDFFAIYGTDVPTELVMGWIDELEGQMLAEIAATHCDAPADARPTVWLRTHGFLRLFHTTEYIPHIFI